VANDQDAKGRWMPAVWVGVDSGKRTHHCVVINQIGMVLLSRRVNNDEAELLELIGAVVDLADGDQVCWATDLNAGGAALLITLLAAHSQRLLYIPGRVVHHAGACQGVCVNRLLILWLGRGSSALDGVPVLAAVKPGRQVRLPGMLTAAARRRDWP
jgi:hypothetical protein